MNKRTPILLAVIILLPMALLAWYGVRDQNNQQQLLQHQFNNLIEQQLRQVDKQLQNHFFALQNQLIPQAVELQERTGGHYTAAALRQYLKRLPQIDQIFVLNADGARIFPPTDQPLNRAEQRFIRKTSTLLQSHELFRPQAADNQSVNPKARRAAVISGSSVAPGSTEDQLYSAQLEPQRVQQPMLLERSRQGFDNPHGWIAWYADTGLQHIFWWQDQQGATLGFSLSSARLLSDLINRLPSDSEEERVLAEAEIRLIDNRGDISYAWGQYRGGESESALRVLPLSHPLGSWRVAYYGATLAAGARNWVGLGALWLLLTCGLSTLAWLLYREHRRELQLAEQRVNFVNQVSHELKTPLTNVRLYAEMLEAELPPEEDAPLAPRYLGVIASESQRLSRLIENVLSFSRLKRGATHICKKPGVVDRCIEQIIENFAPALRDHHLVVRFDADAGTLCDFDGEALEQILNNLISNCEKYAPDGGTIDISSWQQGDQCFIRVRDFGPGISATEGERIFTPFYRISHRLTDGVTGTGIGLGLARDLARAHGGDLLLEVADKIEPGARFLLSLSTPSSTAIAPQELSP